MITKIRKILCVIVCVVMSATAFAVAVQTMAESTPTSSPRENDGDSGTVPTKLSYSILFTEPDLQEKEFYDRTFTRICMEGCLSIGEELGQPCFPVKPIRLLLPQGVDVSNIELLGAPVEMDTHAEGVDLIERPVEPFQKPVPIGEEAPNSLLFDEEAYNSMGLVPNAIYDKLGVDYCRGYAILTIILHPVRCIPREGRLFYFPEMTINIELEEGGYINPLYRNRIDDEEWVESLVHNPEITEYYGNSESTMLDYTGGICDPADNYDYVIITTTYNGLDHWVTTPETPYNWTSLMERHEIEDGLNCTLVTIQEIGACPDYWNDDPLFNDTAAHIREFCKDAYEDWGTSYIFIGGDDEWIPARHMRYTAEPYVDSDIYWNHLDRTFNDDHDSEWGEEGDTGFDPISEMFIGRITCDEPQDVSNWMTKSFYYADSNNIDYLENAAFYGGDTGWLAEGDDFIDYSAIKGTSDWLGPNPNEHGPYPSSFGFQFGFETWNSENPGREYNLSVKWTGEPPNSGWQGGSEEAAVEGFKSAINNDDVTLISGIAHANQDMSLDVQYTSWEADYHNTRPFFIHDYGCHCGDMDAADDGVLHSMLFHSDTELAFACVYNTCFGWGSYESTNSSSALQQKLFWDYMFDVANNSKSSMNWQLGRAMAYSKDFMATYTLNWTTGGAPGSWRGIIQGCLLFGDPAQRIKPPVQPEHDIKVTKLDVPDYIPHNVTTYVKATIVNDGKNDESNILVNFTVNGTVENSTIIDTLNSGQSQLVSFAWDPDVGWYVVGIEAQPVPGENITFNNAKYKTVHVLYSPDIWVDPTEFNFYLNPDETAFDTLTIGNGPTAEADLIFDVLISGAVEWAEQWSHTYGGMGHSHFAQPVGDIDEDRKNETLVGGAANSNAIILSYNPITEDYEQEHEWTEGGVPSGACVVDLDGNGDLEFAVSWVSSTAAGVYAYDWDGTKLTELDHYDGQGVDFVFDVYACDYDEDNDMEVLIANDIRNGGTYHVTALGWSGGSFVHEASWGSGVTTECPMVWSGDTDDDGHIEVIASGSFDKVYALNWNGSNWNEEVVASGLPSHPYAVVCGDIDSDGIDEIGIGLKGVNAYIYEWNGNAYVRTWHGNYPGEKNIIEAMDFGDADNDGDMELLVGTDDVHVVGYSDGSYYEESVITQTDGQLTSAIIGDMDDDGENEVKACDFLDGPGKEWIVECTPDWLSVDPINGIVGVGDSMDLNVTVDSTGLAGAYKAFIIITSNDLDESTIYIPVNLITPQKYCANQDIPVENGGITNDYTFTHDSDDQYEGIMEKESAGKPAKDRYTYLEHKWTIDVGGGYDSYTFYIEAYHTANSEGDDFVFAYSTDDSTYYNMVTVTKTADDDTYQTFVLPDTLSGTVYIRVLDTDQTPGNRVKDTIYIDHMFIDCLL